MADKPQPFTPTREQMAAQGDVQRAIAESQAEFLANRMDEIVDGGRYINDAGELVDAEGQPFKGKGK